MANDVTCPWCGAGDSPRRFKCWECGTPYGVKFALPESYEDSRTRECLRNQLATVTAERDELRCRIDEAPVWWFNPTDLGEPIAMIWEAAGSPAIRVRLVRDDQPEETAK